MDIVVKDVVKRFGKFVALHGVSFEVGRGEKVALLGPNGAGKTTTVRIISGMSKPTRGEVRIMGRDPFSDHSVKKAFGVVSHNTFLYEELTAYENLEFYARLYGADEGRIPELLKEFGLHNRRHELVKNFSRGMKQRLAIARALIHDPKILILDEPTTGLDVFGKQELFSFLENFEGTVLFTTHNLEEAEKTCERALIMSSGKIVFDGGADELEKIYREVLV